ncbi:MAG: hypothetical protein ACI8XM_000705 [Haloarculaceae archaeon]|jgi:hypothetical protein
MQRRAAAVYFILFVLIGAGAYGFMQGMSEPAVELDGQEFTEGSELVVDGRTYTVSAIDAEESDELTEYDGDVELTWFNESKRGTATLENASTTAYNDDEYQVVVSDGSSSTFRLVEELNVSGFLEQDQITEDETVTRDGTEYVIIADSQELRPLSEYLPDRDVVEFSVGDRIEYDADDETVNARIDSISSEGVSLSWSDPGNESVELSQGENSTVNGLEYFAHFPSDDQVQILPAQQEYGTYSSEISAIEHWEERLNGMWGIVILSVLAAVVLLSAAYLPVKG